MDRRRPPETATGYYVLHDFRRVDWEVWRDMTDAERDAALESLRSFLADEADADGDLGLYSVMGHQADLLILVLRPRLAAIDSFERRFDGLEAAAVLTRADSAVGVTEASGYTEAAAAFFDEDETADPGIERYMNARLYPSLPDAAFVSYYPMSKRRGPEQNWYDLSYDRRAELVRSHGEIGKSYAGEVTQLITGTVGFERWEWGVTLFTEDMVAIKDLLTEMRYDPSTSRYAEFGPFYVGRRFPVGDLAAFMAGEEIPTTEQQPAAGPTLADELGDLAGEVDITPTGGAVIVYSEADESAVKAEVAGLSDNFDHYDSHEGTTVTSDGDRTVVVSGWTTTQAAETAAGFLEAIPGETETVVVDMAGTPREGTAVDDEPDDVAIDGDVFAGTPHGEDVHAVVVYSSADEPSLLTAVDELRDGFDRYDTHEGTSVYHGTSTDRLAVVSLWGTGDAASIAAEHLQELPEVLERGEGGTWETMGLFYTVKPDHREAFVETFDEVGQLLADMDGHLETDRLVNVANECDMFIDSRWESREDAMVFFRSDAFSETVEWGRDILADRPRHVFLE